MHACMHACKYHFLIVRFIIGEGGKQKSTLCTFAKWLKIVDHPLFDLFTRYTYVGIPLINRDHYFTSAFLYVTADGHSGNSSARKQDWLNVVLKRPDQGYINKEGIVTGKLILYNLM